MPQTVHKNILLSYLIFGLFFFISTAKAEEPRRIPAIENFEKSQVPVLENVPPTPEASKNKEVIAPKKTRTQRVQDTEGTKAPHQIEGDPILRSKYQGNSGESLEVDPD